ncbi:U11/U12 small nuclear ribonucleoprotein 25 kDa protein isoform X2 [Mobula birostris]|uniref:U11/U12 small nuclear ribonucleoprotein 25 kDa protein isoform X2 n=1 Tax=Mobula birostris TaxID=1983395 RepID=UPI003B282EC5
MLAHGLDSRRTDPPERPKGYTRTWCNGGYDFSPLSLLSLEVTLEEINSQIALEYGQAMTVKVKKGDGEIMPVVVIQNETVLDLKKAIQRYVQLKQEREGGTQYISWKYIWQTYHLTFNGEKLADDKMKLKDYGIRNRDEVTFIKKLRKK